MVEAIVAFALLQDQLSFKVSHHAKLNDCVLQAFDVTRNGSLVGSYGQLGAHDGTEHPLIVIKGTQIVPANEMQLGGYQVASIRPNNRFIVLKWSQPPHSATLVKRNLVIGRATTLPKSHLKGLTGENVNLNPWEQKRLHGEATLKIPSKEAIDKLFPVPEEMSDTTENVSVDVVPYLGGCKLLQVNYRWQMEEGHRVALWEASGRLRPLEQCVPGLAGYQVRGIKYASSDGWFIVDAIRGLRYQKDNVTLGYGNELFWIETAK